MLAQDVCFLRSSRDTFVALCPDFCCCFFFQDLQFEIDTERENFLSLTATGRKILKQMDDGSSGGKYVVLLLWAFSALWGTSRYY